VTKIAIVEDDLFLGKMLKLTLSENSFESDLFTDAEGFLSADTKMEYDMILLDQKLPGITGEELLKLLRKKEILTPVIMLTGVHDIDFKIKTLTNGADDYIEKPINYDELLARVNAVLRRSQGRREIPSDRKIKIGEFIIDLATRKSTSNIGDIILSEKEVKLIKYFIQHPGEVLSRADILEEVWGMNEYPTNRTVDNFILKLRKLYEKQQEIPGHFITIRAVGYRYEP
jgi:DNA-binding response OmpR family regulator